MRAYLKYITIPLLLMPLQANDAVNLRGFFDLAAGYSSDKEGVNFTTGSFDLYFTKGIGDKFTMLTELLFETDGSEFTFDLERLQLNYEHNAYLNATMGKFHTPYGYYNTAFHHGVQLQTAILRPRFLAFEDKGGVMTAHSVGIDINSELEYFKYNVYIANGASIEPAADTPEGNMQGGMVITNNGDHQHKGKLIGLNLAYIYEDLKMGIHGYTQDVKIYGDRESDVQMYGAYMAYDDDTLEILAESYFFSNLNVSDTTNTKRLDSMALFAQVAYNFNGITPYMRFEYTDYNQEDLYFLSQRDYAGDSYSRTAIGVRYDADDDIAIKLGYIGTDERDKVSRYDLLAQLAVAF